MSRIEVDLSGFSATRTELDRVTSQQRAADAEVAAARAALAAAVRAGAATRQTQMLTGRIAAAQASRAALVDQRDALQKQLDGLANDLVRQRDPAALVGSLDGHFPIALLPMRLETRYISARGEAARLRIRIYPDDLNTIDHEAAPTADELVLSPDWLATDNPEALLGGDRAWMVDFDAALANGMAIEVTQAQVVQPNIRGVAPFNLATGTLERLVVVGFEWTKTAADSGADFTDLLAAHRDSSGLGFAALGTPTNNTESAPAGYSPSDQRVPPPPAPNASPEDQDALQLLNWACGIPPAALPA